MTFFPPLSHDFNDVLNIHFLICYIFDINEFFGWAEGKTRLIFSIFFLSPLWRHGPKIFVVCTISNQPIRKDHRAAEKTPAEWACGGYLEEYGHDFLLVILLVTHARFSLGIDFLKLRHLKLFFPSFWKKKYFMFKIFLKCKLISFLKV